MYITGVFNSRRGTVYRVALSVTSYTLSLGIRLKTRQGGQPPRSRMSYDQAEHLSHRAHEPGLVTRLLGVALKAVNAYRYKVIA